jgi:hypothetical protein
MLFLLQERELVEHFSSFGDIMSVTVKQQQQDGVYWYGICHATYVCMYLCMYVCRCFSIAQFLGRNALIRRLRKNLAGMTSKTFSEHFPKKRAYRPPQTPSCELFFSRGPVVQTKPRFWRQAFSEAAHGRKTVSMYAMMLSV